MAATLLSQCVAGTATAAAKLSTSSSASTPSAGQSGHLDTTRAEVPGVQLWPTFDWTAAAPQHQPQNGTTSASATAAAADQQQQQQLPLHMSISRTVPIKRIQIESLQAALTKQLKPFKAFRVQLQGLLALVNDAKARSFVGVRVAAAGEKQVSRALPGSEQAASTCVEASPCVLL